MEFTFKKATLADLELLTESRIEVLRAVFKVPADTDMSETEEVSRKYYQESLTADRHAAYLVFAGPDAGGMPQLAGAGGVSFYQVMPTCHNPSGEKAYIMNMYTRPEYRRQGIAGRVLELLIQEAHERGITYITLDASDMGRPVYEKHGFEVMKDEMKLKE